MAVELERLRLICLTHDTIKEVHRRCDCGFNLPALPTVGMYSIGVVVRIGYMTSSPSSMATGNRTTAENAQVRITATYDALNRKESVSTKYLT